MDVVRILVVEDSLTIRKHIVDALSSAPGLEVVGEAGDGKTAIDLCRRLRPDVVTMDMMLPVMTGLAATEYIMAHCPTPILIVSASTNRGEVFKTYDALAAGAVDVIEKPDGAQVGAVWERQLAEAVRLVSRIRVITHLRAKLTSAAGTKTVPRQAWMDVADEDRRVVAIGASTGGPAAVLAILSALPENFPLPILLAMHISKPFGAAMAEWLDGETKLPVRYARHGEQLPRPGNPCVLMAPPGRHLELAGRCLHLSDGPERHSCRPSVDVLFDSLAQGMGKHTVACLLTGMGKDGAMGMLAVKERGGLTIAQDEPTSVVFGMPGEAVKLGAVNHVVPVQEIGPLLARISASPRRTMEVRA